MRTRVRSAAAAVIVASLAAPTLAVNIPLRNNSFEEPISASNASVDPRGPFTSFNTDPNDFRLLSSADNSILGDPVNARTASVTIPGWQLFQSGFVDNSDPRGFDDDDGAFDGTVYAFSNEGNDVLLWSDLTAATVNEGDWITVMWSAASDRMNETMTTAAWLSFDGEAPTDGFFPGQTGQGEATTLGAYGQYNGSLAGNGAPQTEAPQNYETYSRTKEISAAEAAEIAASGGLRVGIQAFADRGQMRIDNIFLDVSSAPSEAPIVLIGGDIGNGNFQDLTGATATGTDPLIDAADQRFIERGDGVVTLPGWTVDSFGLGGIDDQRAGADGAGDPHVIGNGSADVNIISNSYGRRTRFFEGDVLRLSYEQARNTGAGNQDFEAFFDFDGDGDEVVSVGEAIYDISRVGDTAAAFETEVLLYTLTAEDAINANLNGVGVILNADNADNNQWRLDNVRLELFSLTIPEPSSVSLLALGLVGFLGRRR